MLKISINKKKIIISCAPSDIERKIRSFVRKLQVENIRISKDLKLNIKFIEIY